MRCGIASSIVISLLLFGMFTLAFGIPLVRAAGTIYIRADGNVEPPTKLFQRDGDLYTFTSDIYDEIVVERDDIIIDGNGYTLQGTGAGNGFFLCERTNVTIKNVRIVQFHTGIHLSYCTRINMTGNTLISCAGGVIGIIINHLAIQENIMISSNFGIDLSKASWCTIAGNSIVGNLDGVRLSYSSSSIFYHNSFVNNNRHVYSHESVNAWDAEYPCGGNYWSGYHGEDNFSGVKQDQPGSDAIGDSPYKMDENNVDRYPLMECWSTPSMVRIFIRLVYLWDLSRGRENSLTSKLYDAIHLLNKGNWNGAVRKFVDFTNVVFFTLQDAAQKQNQIYNQLSNCLKSRHNWTLACINNIR